MPHVHRVRTSCEERRDRWISRISQDLAEDPTGLLSFYPRRGCKMTRWIVSFPGETRIRRKLGRCERFRERSSSSTRLNYSPDRYRGSWIHSRYLFTVSRTIAWSLSRLFCSNDEGTAGIKCAEKKRFRV